MSYLTSQSSGFLVRSRHFTASEPTPPPPPPTEPLRDGTINVLLAAVAKSDVRIRGRSGLLIDTKDSLMTLLSLFISHFLKSHSAGKYYVLSWSKFLEFFGFVQKTWKETSLSQVKAADVLIRPRDPSQSSDDFLLAAKR